MQNLGGHQDHYANGKQPILTGLLRVIPFRLLFNH